MKELIKRLIKRLINFTLDAYFEKVAIISANASDDLQKDEVLKEYHRIKELVEFQNILKPVLLSKYMERLKQIKGLFADQKSYNIVENLMIFDGYENNIIRYLLVDEINEVCNVDCEPDLFKLHDFVVRRYDDPEHYYPADLIKLGEHEVFLDGGAYVGDTIDQFLNKIGNKFEAIYAFEPSVYNYNALLHHIENYPRRSSIKVLNCGLSTNDTTIYYPKDQLSGDYTKPENITDFSKFEATELKNINTVLTPEEINSITFIKLDVEGAEMETLQSMKELIKNNLPKMAISVYHKPNDMVDIPVYIRSLTDGYNLYLRHHSNWRWETVLYCVKKT
jgi:FkbM family methyltransferase